MALRKQDLYGDDEQGSRGGKRSRLTVDINPGLRRRVKMAAINKDVSISELVEDVLEKAFPEEESPRQTQRQPISRKTLEHILLVRKEIMEHTKGKVFEDSTEIVRQMREERSRELEHL